MNETGTPIVPKHHDNTTTLKHRDPITGFSPQSGNDLKKAVNECLKPDQVRDHQQWMDELGKEAFRRKYMPNMADIPGDMMSGEKGVPDPVSTPPASVTKKHYVSDSSNPGKKVTMSSVGGPTMSDCTTSTGAHAAVGERRLPHVTAHERFFIRTFFQKTPSV